MSLTKRRHHFKPRDGVNCIIVNKGKVLLLRRRRLPFIPNPGKWCFVMGGRDKGERYIETALRETKEETGLAGKHLRLAQKPVKMKIYDTARPRYKWENMIFLFCSDTRKVRRSLENAEYRWAGFDDLRKQNNYTNIYIDEKRILKMISAAIRKCG